MADTVTTQSAAPATVPANTVIATDDAGASGHVQIVKLARSTDGSATPITADADGMLVNLGSNNDVTVTGTVAVTQSGTWDEVGINDSGNSITVDDGSGSLTVDNGGTFVVQENGAALTALQLIDDTVYTDGTGTPSKAIGIAGTDGTNPQIIKTDTSGELQVDVLSSTLPSGAATAANQSTANTALSAIQTAVEILDNTVSGNELQVDVLTMPTVTVNSHAVTNAGTFAVQVDGSALTALQLLDDAVATDGSATPTKGILMAGQDGTNAQTVKTDSDGNLQVDVLSVSGTVTVDGSGVTQPVSHAALTELAAAIDTEVQVDVVTMPNVTLAAGTNTNEVVGDVAHDAAAAGNPLLLAGISQDMDDTAPPNQVSAENDATRLATDRDGALFVHTHGPRIWSYHLDTSTAQTDASVHAAPAAGLSLYVQTIVFSSDGTAAINLFFEEGASKVLGPYYLPATAGGVKLNFDPPKKITAATALTLTTSASHAHSVDVTGFTGQG